MISQLLTTVLLATAANAKPIARSLGQQPYKLELPNGFPNISVPSDALTAIEKQAHGTLPNSPLPTSLAAADANILELVAFNEIFEVAYFTSLIANITNNVPGYKIHSSTLRSYVLETLTAIQAQEELHALGANAILASAGHSGQVPCEYKFPVDNFDDAIALASTFTDVVLGTLQDAQQAFATNGDTALVPLFGSIVGQEGEQDGYFRSVLSNIPSQLPFLTRSTGPFAYSVLNQDFIIPGSCPTASLIDVPIFGPLAVNNMKPAPVTQELEFTFMNNGTKINDMSLVYINQQNLPVVESIRLMEKTKPEEMDTVQAKFPYEGKQLNGLTLAVLTNCPGPFANADEVAAATLFGPAIIEIM